MAANTEELAILVRMKDFATKEFQRLRGTIGKFGSFVGGTFKGISRAIFSVKGALAGLGLYLGTQAIGNMISYAGEIQGIERAFTNLTKSADGAASTLKALRAGTKGTVDDFNLMKLANQAILLGVAKTGEEFEELTTLARRLGQAVGRTTTEAFGDLATGIGRQSRLILDNLGIIVKVEKANEEYARTLGKTTAQLTDAEKKQAFLNATLTAAREKVAELGDDTTSLIGSWGELKATFANISQTVLKSLTPAITETITAIQKFLDENSDQLVDFLADAIQSTTKMTIAVLQLAKSVNFLGVEAKDVFTTLRRMKPLAFDILEAVAGLFGQTTQSAQNDAANFTTTIDAMIAALETAGTGMDDLKLKYRQILADKKDVFVGPPIPEDLLKSFQAIDRLKAERAELLAQFDRYMDERIKKEEELAWKEVQWAIENSAARRKAMEEYSAIYTIMGGLGVEFAKMADESRQYGVMVARGMRGAADAITYGLVDALGAVVDRTKTAKEAFSDMARSILSDMARIAQQEAIGGLVKGLFGAVGGLFSAGAGSLFPATSGPGALGLDKAFDLSSFTGAPGFQLGGRVRRTGLYALHAGEEVVPQPVTRYAEAAPVAGSNVINISVSVPGTTPLAERDMVLRQARLIGQVAAEEVNRSLSTRNRMRGRA